MKTAAIIQARMGSTRLPGKVLMDMCGKPVIERLVERVSRSCVDNVIVATGNEEGNEPLIKWCHENDTPVFVGSEDDVLGRVLECAQFYSVDRIVDITGDCPLVDYRHIDHLCKAMNKYQTVNYASNITPRTWPDGFDIQIYPTEALEQVDEKLSLYNPLREHVGINIHQIKPVFFNYGAPQDCVRPTWGLTLDTEEDFKLLEIIFTEFDKRDYEYFSARVVIDYLKRNPRLLLINNHIKRKGINK